ncbi:MAG: DUF4231 domain-containing protein [Verrucomicrobiota bacterium]
MNEEQKQNTEDPFSSLIELKQKYADKSLDWYRKNANLPRRAYRTCGTLAIVFSAAIPFLAASRGLMSNPEKEIVVSVIAVCISILTGLNAFFTWQSSWQKRITAKMTLEYLIADWESKLVTARRQSDPQIAFQEASEATDALLKATHDLSANETSDWFSNISFPDSKTGKSPGQPSS